MNEINFDEVLESGFIDKPGEYELIIKGFESKTFDSGAVAHKFNCSTDNGKTINMSLFLTPKALWKYKKFMKILGFPMEGTVDVDKTSNSAVGRRFRALVDHGRPIVDVVTGEEKPGYLEVVDFAETKITMEITDDDLPF